MPSPLLSKGLGDDLISAVYKPVGVVSIKNGGVFGVVEVESKLTYKSKSPQTIEK